MTSDREKPELGVHGKPHEDLENSIQQLISLSNPVEAANGFVKLGKEYYKQQRDIDGVIAIGDAGARFCIKSVAAASDVETATSLRTFARTIAYNAAANCWPGWGDEGVDIENAHLEAGLKLAFLTRELVQELELGAKEIGTSHWLVGALELAAGRLQEATVDFEKSEKAYELGGYPVSRLLARGYSALARKRDASASVLGAAALAEVMNSLRVEGSKEAIFFANQLATADKIFCEDVPLDNTAGPDSSAVRVALWRAIHVQADAPPHVLNDEIGLQLVAPDEGWRQRPDMHPEGTKLFRAAIVARARFIDDLVIEQAARGTGQYVILGAGLDSFVQRRPEMASRLTVFEIDQPGTQTWKRQRLIDLGFGVPDWLRLVPVDFEAGASWLERLKASGFDSGKPAVVASTGVSMYLTKDAVAATLRDVASLASGSVLAMTFTLPLELVDAEVRPGFERALQGARASGTPFLSFFTPAEMLALAREAGFKAVQHVSGAMLSERYFQNRSDGFRPPNNAEELLVATTG